jgi:hypothetical protein
VRKKFVAIAAAIVVAGVLMQRDRFARLFHAGRAPNVLLISIDTLRADRLGSYGYGAAQTRRLTALPPAASVSCMRRRSRR